MGYDGEKLYQKLMEYYSLRTRPVAFRYYEDRSEIENDKRFIPTEGAAMSCVLVGKAAYRGFCQYITTEHMGAYCAGVNGMCKRTAEWYERESKDFVDRFIGDEEGARRHHESLTESKKLYQAFAVAPLAGNCIESPDGVAMFVTPEQLFWMLLHLQHKDYKLLDFRFVGESTCSDGMVVTRETGKVGISIGGVGERAFGGLPNTELIISMTIADLEKMLESAKIMRYDSRFDRSHPVVPLCLGIDMAALGNHFDFVEREEYLKKHQGE